MHWPLAISRNLDALRAVVAAIAALLSGHDHLIARRLRNAAFAMLRPAEAAARRLIVIAAQGLVLAAPAAGSFAFAGQGRAAPASGSRPSGCSIRSSGLRASSAPPPPGSRASAPSGDRRPWPPLPRRPRPGRRTPKRRSGPRPCGFASPRSKRRSPTCRDRRGGWRAGGPAGKPASRSEADRLRFRPPRCASAGRRAGARGPAMRSTACCANAMARARRAGSRCKDS